MPAATAKPAFEEHLTGAFDDLRRAIGSLISSTGSDPAEPQETARRLGLNRNLTWKVSKVVTGSNLYEALQHLPGAEGIEILVRAARSSGAPEAIAGEVRRAQSVFEHLVEVHTGDRATLDLILDNMGGTSSQRLEQSRKLAFRGNSGVWGTQARVRVTSIVLTPNAQQPDLIDAAMIAGVVDFRRLRPGVRWPFFRPRVYSETGGDRTIETEQAIDPAHSGSGPRFMTQFCDPFPPPLVAVSEGGALVYEFAEAPIGNTGAVTCFLGSIARQTGPRYATPSDRTADFLAQVTMPSELLLFDLLVHRDLDHWGDPETQVVGQLLGMPPRATPYQIPLNQPAESLPGSPPMLHCSQVPRYEELMLTTLDRLGYARANYRVLRLLIKYPPMHSIAVMRFNLPEQS